MLSLAYRTFANAEKVPTHLPREQLERKLVFIGLVGIYDPPRPESRQSVELCRRAGIEVHMLTGDHPLTAAAIAREVGILPVAYPETEQHAHQARLITTASRSDRMSDKEIDELSELPKVIARCTPDTKVKMIQALHRRKRIVSMTGDGVNGMGALLLHVRCASCRCWWVPCVQKQTRPA